uniref:Apoptosis-associated speck-like protein containing a CARD n=1 Tax=Terrapene triunguis TaxID=2587831 RepID=A0A674J072_9SAUR
MAQQFALETLDDLGEDDLKRFKHKLKRMQLEKGYQAIPWGRLEKGDPVDVTDLLISHYGERYGVEVAVQVLREIKHRALAERLTEAISAGKPSSPSSISASPRRPSTPGGDEHFVNQHRAQLIQRVMAVDGILDSLYGPVLDLEQIQSIRAERSSVEKMRKLYELVPKWDNDCKDRLYQALKEKHRPLVEELEGI